MNEHYQRIASIAEDLICGLHKDKEQKVSRLPSGEKNKAVYVPDADRRRKALRLVEECYEYDCPPPPEVIEALRLAFMDSERRPLGAKTIAEEFTTRLMSGEAGIEPKSWRAFRSAADADAESCEIGPTGDITFNASVNSVALSAGVDRKLIRLWRDNAAYKREIRLLMGK